MLPIACAARSFWLEGQSTIDHRQNVTTDPWHHSYDFKSGKQHNFNILLFHYFTRIANVTFNLKLRFFRYIVGVFLLTVKSEYSVYMTRVFCLCLFQEFLTRKLYSNKFTSSVFFFLFRKLVSSVWRKFVKRVDVIRHFLSKVSRSTLQVRDITVRLYRFTNSDKFKALVTAKFWL